MKFNRKRAANRLPNFGTINHQLSNHQPTTGWFVPDARWLELREALADKIESLEKN